MRVSRIFTTLLAVVGGALLDGTSVVAKPIADSATSAAPVELVVSVPDQSMAVLRDGELLGKFPISTSKFGLGDEFGSYKTPLGEFKVCEKVGAGLPQGAVLQGRQATGEVLPPNARGRDPIVTRILWLEGTEPRNENARQRGIYIHGTAEEKRIGTAASYGCIRMRSRDVVKIFDWSELGCRVRIETGKLKPIVRAERAARAARLAAIRDAQKAARLAANDEGQPAPVASGPSKLPAQKTADKKPASAASVKIASIKVSAPDSENALMRKSILDYASYSSRDTIAVRGSEVQLRPEATNLASTAAHSSRRH